VKTLLIVDTETGGLDASKDPLLEVAWAGWSIEHGCVMGVWSTLVHAESNEAAAINGISLDLLRQSDHAVGGVLSKFARAAEFADAIVAHNASFDRSFLVPTSRPWICSCRDIEWPGVKHGTDLIRTAVGLGVPVTGAHRALTDALLLCRCFEAVWKTHGGPLFVENMLARAMRPRIRVVACVDFKNNKLAKDLAFAWDADRRCWWKDIAAADVETTVFPFKISVGPVTP
jgi:DNA polymerase III epsilon subunit-like protein